MSAHGLVTFDLDGVLVKERSAWWTLHNAFGTYADSRENMTAYRRGEIDYPEFMRRDIALWGRRTIKVVEEILGAYTLNPFAEEVCAALVRAGYELAIVSAGLDIIARPVAEKLHVKYWAANGLEVSDSGHLTGEGVYRVDLIRKDQALKNLIGPLGISLADTIAVGDSEYDVQMMSACGASVALQEDGLSTVWWPESAVKITRLDALPRVLGC